MTYEVGKFKLNFERLNEVGKLLLNLERSIEVRKINRYTNGDVGFLLNVVG